MEATETFIDRWVAKQFVVHTHTGIHSNVHASTDYHTINKWSKSERQIPYNITYVESKIWHRTFLLVQWGGVCLTMHTTWVQSLVHEDSTSHRIPRFMCHSYWACPLEPVRHTTEALTPPVVLCNKRSHHNEEPAQYTARKSSRCSWQVEKAHTQWRPSIAKKKL